MAYRKLAHPGPIFQERDIATEEWRPCPGFANYEVSSLGRVRRLTTVTCAVAGSILHPSSPKGYDTYNLSLNGTQYRRRINRLVCEAFHGPAPSDLHVAAHSDSDLSNNRSNNLRWATQLENEDDKTKALRRPTGEKSYNAIFSEADIISIRHSTKTSYNLAKQYGIRKSTIENIRARRSWKHIV